MELVKLLILILSSIVLLISIERKERGEPISSAFHR